MSTINVYQFDNVIAGNTNYAIIINGKKAIITGNEAIHKIVNTDSIDTVLKQIPVEERSSRYE